MRTGNRGQTAAPAELGFLLDELRASGVTRYADLASVLNRQGIRPPHGRWNAHKLYLLMRRHRRQHPAAAVNAGTALYARRAEEAVRVIRRPKRRGLKTQTMLARALNARGLTTPGFGRPWSARNISRVLTTNRRGRRHHPQRSQRTLH